MFWFKMNLIRLKIIATLEVCDRLNRQATLVSCAYRKVVASVTVALMLGMQLRSRGETADTL